MWTLCYVLHIRTQNGDLFGQVEPDRSPGTARADEPCSSTGLVQLTAITNASNHPAPPTGAPSTNPPRLFPSGDSPREAPRNGSSVPTDDTSDAATRDELVTDRQPAATPGSPRSLTALKPQSEWI